MSITTKGRGGGEPVLETREKNQTFLYGTKPRLEEIGKGNVL
jgi:hypothetical protein